jgi:hypothetical protein
VLAGTPILVSAARGDHRAGVRRDGEGRLWIAHWTAERPDRVAGTRLEGLDPACIGGPEWWVVGARAPAGVRAVEARDEAGAWHPGAVAQGAWVAFVDGGPQDHGIPPVRLRDATGGLVSRAAPERLQTARRLEEHELRLLAMGPTAIGGPCPVCRADDWRAAPAAGGSGERVFCAVCGHDDGANRAFWASARPG